MVISKKCIEIIWPQIVTFLEWCLLATSKYPEITINDFTSSWRDGLALNCLIKSYDESLVDLSEVSRLRGEDRLENALSLSKRHFKVSRLIYPKEFQNEHLSTKSVVCYLMSLYLGMVATTAEQRSIAKKSAIIAQTSELLTFPDSLRKAAKHSSQPLAMETTHSPQNSLSDTTVNKFFTKNAFTYKSIRFSYLPLLSRIHRSNLNQRQQQ